MMGGSVLHNASELLALLCVAGIVACAVRWPQALRRDFLLAFGLFLAGTLTREIVVFYYGATGWPLEAVWWSASGRVIQILGAALFVRGSLKNACGEWGWLLVFGLAAFFAGVI